MMGTIVMWIIWLFLAFYLLVLGVLVIGMIVEFIMNLPTDIKIIWKGILNTIDNLQRKRWGL